MGVLVLFFLVATTAAVSTRKLSPQLEMDQAIPYDQYAVGYDCSSVKVAHIAVVCELCQATVAYMVFHGETEYLTGLYSEQREMLGRAVDDIKVRLPVANYTVAFSDSDICVSAHEFEGRPNLQLVFTYFGAIQPREIEVPELFDLRGKTELDYIAVHTKDTESEYQYSNLTISYKADESVTVSPTLSFDLEYMTIRCLDESAEVYYTGMAAIETVNSPFMLALPYDREAQTPFTVLITPSEQIGALDFAAMIDPQASCGQTVDVPGLSSQGKVTVDLIGLTFKYHSQKSAANLLQVTEFYQLPDVAVLPLLLLKSVTGQYQIDSQTHSCAALVTGSANYTYPLQIQIFADNKQWWAQGGISQESITVSEIESTFYMDFFLRLGESILPQYNGTYNSQFLANFRQLSLRNPDFRFSANPIFHMQVTGLTLWGSSEETLAQILIGWVNELVESVVVLSLKGRDDVVAGDSSIVVVQERIVAATSDIKLAMYPYMRGEGNQDVDTWLHGISASAKIAPGEACDSNPFCAMVAQSAAALTQFTLTGSVIQDKLNLRCVFPPVQLVNNLTFTETELVLEVTSKFSRLFVQGGFLIQTEENALLRFAGNITDSGGAAVLEARSESTWESPMGMEGISISTLKIRGVIEADLGLTNSTVRGLAVVGESCQHNFQTDKCVSGTVDVSFDPSNFTFNAYTIRLSGMPLQMFMQVIVGINIESKEELPFALRGLDFSSSLDLIYPSLSSSQGMSILGPISYFETTGSMQATTPSLGVGIIDFSLSLNEFHLGNYNVWVRRRGGDGLTVSMNVRGAREDVDAIIAARVQVWESETDVDFTVNHMGLQAAFVLNPCAGLYPVTIELQSPAEFSALTEAEITLKGKIPITELATEQAAVRTDLQFWIQRGADALDAIDGWKDNSTSVGAAAQSRSCPDDFCPEVLNCVSAPSAHCALYSHEQTCSQNKTSCAEPVSTCAQTSPMCVASSAKCITVDNSVCVDWVSICDATVDVCTEWTQQCGSSEERSCATYELIEVTDKCLEYKTACETGKYADYGCVARCQQNDNFAQEAAAASEAMLRGYQNAVQKLLGFRSMYQQLSYQGYTSDLFSLISADFQTVLSEAGISAQDIDYRVAFFTFVAGGNEKIRATDELPWNFVERELNELTLLRSAKRVLISSSNSTLSMELATRTPLEVAMESLQATP